MSKSIDAVYAERARNHLRCGDVLATKNDGDCLLAQVGHSVVAVICLKTGNRLRDPVAIDGTMTDLTKEDVEQIMRQNVFTVKHWA